MRSDSRVLFSGHPDHEADRIILPGFLPAPPHVKILPVSGNSQRRSRSPLGPIPSIGVGNLVFNGACHSRVQYRLTISVEAAETSESRPNARQGSAERLQRLRFQ